MRVYVPTTLERLHGWYHDDVLAPPVAGWAVTDALRAEFPDLDDEESEYAVSTAAAESSQQLLLDDLRKRGRRVVVVAELPYSVLEADEESPGAVTVVTPLKGRRSPAVLADAADVPLTGPGEVDDLAWFASQEIPELLASNSTN